MNADQLWKQVGRHLLVVRTERGLARNKIRALKGPTDKIVKRIEEGKNVYMKSLNAYAQALGLSIIDVLRTVLVDPAQSRSPEAEMIVRRFEAMTVEDRQAIVRTFRAFPSSADEPRGNR